MTASTCSNSNMNTLTIKNTAQLEIIVIIQVNTEVLYIALCNLKYSSPKEILVVFHNGSNFDYNVITKELGKEFEEDIHGLRENNKNYKDFSYPITRELVKMDRKLQKTYLTNYDLLKVQDLCLAHYQTLLLISLK